MPASSENSKKDPGTYTPFVPQNTCRGVSFINSSFFGSGICSTSPELAAGEPPRSFAKWRQGAHTYRSTGLSALLAKTGVLTCEQQLLFMCFFGWPCSVVKRGFVEDEILSRIQLCGNHKNTIVRIPTLSNQYFMESKGRLFLSWLNCLC